MNDLIRKLNSKEWQVVHSSLAKIKGSDITYEECRKYACEDIAKNTKLKFKEEKDFIIEIPKGTSFHFIGRVDTSTNLYDVDDYYQVFEKRKFISFSTINNKNISHYKGRAFLLYNIQPEDIVHVFPCDSNTRTDTGVMNEKDLTLLPSLWLNLNDLEELTNKLKVYNQVTCKTKRNKKILKPIAVVAFDKIDEGIKIIAKKFDIGIVLVHPDEDAINYDNDLILYDEKKLNEVSYIIEEIYNIPVRKILAFSGLY